MAEPALESERSDETEQARARSRASASGEGERRLHAVVAQGEAEQPVREVEDHDDRDPQQQRRPTGARRGLGEQSRLRISSPATTIIITASSMSRPLATWVTTETPSRTIAAMKASRRRWARPRARRISARPRSAVAPWASWRTSGVSPAATRCTRSATLGVSPEMTLTRPATATTNARIRASRCRRRWSWARRRSAHGRCRIRGSKSGTMQTRRTSLRVAGSNDRTRAQLMLMLWARIGGAATDRAPEHLGAVPRAVPAGLPGRHVVAGVRAAAPLERRAGWWRSRGRGLRTSSSLERVGRSGGVDAGAEEHLVDEQVAEPGDARLVHEHRLDRRAARAGEPARSVARLDRERVDAEPVLVRDRARPRRAAAGRAGRASRRRRTSRRSAARPGSSPFAA